MVVVMRQGFGEADARMAWDQVVRGGMHGSGCLAGSCFLEYDVLLTLPCLAWMEPETKETNCS